MIKHINKKKKMIEDDFASKFDSMKICQRLQKHKQEGAVSC